MKSLFILLLFCLPILLKAQNGFEEKTDTIKHRKMLTGTGSIDALKNDTSFTWYDQNYLAYKPDSASVETLKKYKERLFFVVFAGTWCGDTKKELPRFYKAMSSAGITDHRINLHFLDRTKKSKDGLTKKYKIKKVPTIILFIDGKKKMKIVEAPKISCEADFAKKIRKELEK